MVEQVHDTDQPGTAADEGGDGEGGASTPPGTIRLVLEAAVWLPPPAYASPLPPLLPLYDGVVVVELRDAEGGGRVLARAERPVGQLNPAGREGAGFLQLQVGEWKQPRCGNAAAGLIP